jgi:hypothetical protein
MFKLLLYELFLGSGYLAERLGRKGDGGYDIIIKYPRNGEIKFIDQAKNWKPKK